MRLTRRNRCGVSSRRATRKEEGYVYVLSPYLGNSDRLRKEIARAVGDVPRQKRLKPPANPIPEIAAAHEVAFEPVEGVKPDQFLWSKCTESLDVVWGTQVVYVMAEKGVLRSIFKVSPSAGSPIDPDGIHWVTWDGANFWIVCRYSGIHLVSPQGDRLCGVGGKQGLPPYESTGYFTAAFSLVPPPLIFHPIGPGKCIAIGTLPDGKRKWFALLSTSPAADGPLKVDVKVFHTATKLPTALADGSDDDIQQTFGLAWATEYAPEASGKRLLLIGRQTQGKRRPLAIDLESLQVSILPAPIFTAPDVGNHLLHGARQDRCRRSLDDRPLLASRREGWRVDAEATYRIRFDQLRQSDPSAAVGPRRQLYLPGCSGSLWIRRRGRSNACGLRSCRAGAVRAIRNFRALRADCLESGQSAVPDSIAPTRKPTHDLEAVYPFVPAARRSAHHQAVLAIRALGGSVASRWGYCRHLIPANNSDNNSFNRWSQAAVENDRLIFPRHGKAETRDWNTSDAWRTSAICISSGPTSPTSD